MAVVIHNATFTAGAVSSNSIGLLHTATAGSVLLVFISSLEANGQSAVAVGGVPMTHLGSSLWGGGTLQVCDVWGLTAPNSGVLTISAIHVGNNPSIWAMGAVTYVGQKTDGSPFGGVASKTATGTTSLLLSVSATAGNLIVAGFTVNGSDLSLATGITTQLSAVASTTLKLVVGDIAATGATHTLTAVAATNHEWAALGVHLIASATGAPATINGSATLVDVADTFSASGYAVVRGSLAATDAPDTFSASGDVIVCGTFAATDAGGDTFSASGGVRVRGTLSATDPADTFAAPGYVRVTGTLAATDAPDTFAATGKTIITGLLSGTDAADTFASPGKLIIRGSLVATDAQDSFVGLSGLAVRSATFAATDAPDIFSASGTVVAFAPNITGDLVATDAPDTLAATGTSSAADAPVTAPAPAPGLGGKPERRKSKKPPYIPAQQDFWEARERYLESLQPEIVFELEPEALPPNLPETLPKQVNPQLQAFRVERQEIIDALPLATSMRQLRAAGERLIAVNARIAEQKRLQLAALAAEQAALQAIQKAERRRKLARIRVLKRKAVLLAAAEVSIALSHMQRNY